MCGHEWLRRLFLHERQHFTHSVSVFVSTPFTLSLAACRASGSSLASSQEVKLNCRARLPNDERLRHPGMLWARTESSEREKMLAFQLNVFFPASFFFFLVSVFPVSGWAFFFYLHIQVLAPQPWSESSSWETGGWMEWGGGGGLQKNGQRQYDCVCVCVCMCVCGKGVAFAIIKWTECFTYSILYSVFFKVHGRLYISTFAKDHFYCFKVFFVLFFHHSGRRWERINWDRALGSCRNS